MKTIFKYLVFILWIFVPNTYAQLDQFMILTYHQRTSPFGDPESFFCKLKSEYKFNTILLCDPYIENEENFKKNSLAAQNQGLKVLLYLHNLHSRKNIFNPDKAKLTLQRFSDPQYGVIGYHIVDEPFVITSTYPNGYIGENRPVNQFYDFIDNIPQYAKTIENYNPALLRYANLNPISFIVKNRDIKTGDKEYREDYIQKYIDTSKPNLLSFDHYPIWLDLPYFYYSLYDMALKSVENSLPFIYILASINSYEPYNNSDSSISFNAKKLSEFYYMIYSGLSYGAKGIGYYPGFEWIMTKDQKGRFINIEKNAKESLSALHNKLIVHSDILLSLNFISAYHRSNFNPIKPERPEFIHPFCTWSNLSSDECAKAVFINPNYPLLLNGVSVNLPKELVITFMKDQIGKIYFWVFNRSLNESYSFKANTKSDYKDVLNNKNYLSTGIGLFSLLPGEAKLFDSGTKMLYNYDIDDKSYENNFYPLKTAKNIFLGSSLSDTVIFNEGATISFCADNIVIKSLHAKKGSTVRFISTPKVNIPFLAKSGILENYILSFNTEQKYDERITANIFPNPLVNGLINLYVDLDEGKILDVFIYNSMGEVIKKEKISDVVSNINIANYPSGVYIVSIYDNNQIYNLKVIK